MGRLPSVIHVNVGREIGFARQRSGFRGGDRLVDQLRDLRVDRVEILSFEKSRR